jgi:hypothetical protein
MKNRCSDGTLEPGALADAGFVLLSLTLLLGPLARLWPNGSGGVFYIDVR